MESNAFIEDTYENDFFWAFKVKKYSINTLSFNKQNSQFAESHE